MAAESAQKDSVAFPIASAECLCEMLLAQIRLPCTKTVEALESNAQLRDRDNSPGNNPGRCGHNSTTTWHTVFAAAQKPRSRSPRFSRSPAPICAHAPSCASDRAIAAWSIPQLQPSLTSVPCPTYAAAHGAES